MPLAKPLNSNEGHKILARDHYRCQYCGLDASANFENSLIMTVDFILPRAKKGGKKPENLVAACRPCNVIKGHRVFKSFEDAKAYILKRRAALNEEWEAGMAKLEQPVLTVP
jgi:5-methylcytosine-specific restriction endonuclease McrA